MAQYGRTFYGTTYYGRTNVFSGWYETEEVFTDEPLDGTVNVVMLAKLPSATYGPLSPQVVQTVGTWEPNGTMNISSDVPGNQIKLTATGDEVLIKYEKRTMAATVNINVVTREIGKNAVSKDFVLSTESTTVDANATYTIPGLPFGEQEITITIAAGNTSGDFFTFKGFKARTSNIILEGRSRTAEEPKYISNAGYSRILTTSTWVNEDYYILRALTPSYAGDSYIQFKLHLGSSDNETAPQVDYIEISSGDTSNRAEDGTWAAILDMEQIAIQAGSSFANVEEIDWEDVTPDGTKITVRSQSSMDNNIIWDKVTVPYIRGTNRVALREGYNAGWIDAPINAPASKRPHLTTLEWQAWEDRSFLPPDNAGASVMYRFLDTLKSNEANPYHQVTNPMNTADKNLRGTSLQGFDNYLRIQLRRTALNQTPVVDFVNLTALMHYEQDVEVVAQEFSAVDNNNTGKNIVLDMTDAEFQNQWKVPETVTNPTYTLVDRTGRPQEILLYLDSEKEKGMRTNVIENILTDKVWAEARLAGSGSQSKITKHYQYGGGEVKFPNVDEIEMVSVFTPSLNPTLRYRYHLESGWPTQYHTVTAGDTLVNIANLYLYTESDILALNPKLAYDNQSRLVPAQRITLPNDTDNTDVKVSWKGSGGSLTQKSAHNSAIEGKSDMQSDSVAAEIVNANIYGWVDWVSEEKIYDGVINLNDIRSEYKRSHLTPDSGDSIEVDYVAVMGDTYGKIALLFDLYEEDVRLLNNAGALSEPMIGQVVRIPSKIVLPTIHPKAVVETNPYQIDIVYNSVKKKNGKVIPASNLVVKPIQIEYREVTVQDVEVRRGAIEHGKDLLQHSRVLDIVKVQSGDGMRLFNKYDETLNIGDYRLTENYIDWSPVSYPADEPEMDEVYLVDYVAEIPKKVTVTIDTTYMEEGGVDRIWRSYEVKEFEGMCYPGMDFVAELPSFNNWLGLPDPMVEDIEYIVEDNDLWVKTWVEKRDDKWYVIGSLQDRVPKDNWFPLIKTGYYYLGKEEFYMFNEPIEIAPTERDVPIAENVEFVPGKFENAAKLQEGSANKIRNSGFDVATTPQISYKLSF